MNRISSTVRITIGLACLAVTVFLGAKTIGLVPDRLAAVTAGRAALCENIAVQCSLLASRNDLRAMRTSLEATLSRNPDMLFAGVRRRGGPLLIKIGTREANAVEVSKSEGSDSYMVVPLMASGQPWGSVEIAFRPSGRAGVWRILDDPTYRLSAFIALASFVAYYRYLRKLLQDLDPSQVIPDRVRTTLDTFAEGLLVLDNRERIVLANQSFAKTLGRPALDLQGCRVSELPWTSGTGKKKNSSFPWKKAIAEGKPQTGAMLGLKGRDLDRRTFLVNTAPILGDNGEHRGALASFDDVTSLENSRSELLKMLQMLKTSRDEVRRKNHELQLLANRDPLTACLNRRSFFEQFETHWNNAQRYGHPLACIMVDIDHFKVINDSHGHGVGDQVLQKVAAVLTSTARDGDLICRYGGEEFCILFPHLDIDSGQAAAERHRQAIESSQMADLSVTASIGLSATGFGAGDPQHLIDQADKSLYAAKRQGRNRVARWDETQAESRPDAQNRSHVGSPRTPDPEVPIPFHAVTALISALAYRDAGTAEHSRRVADLCVALASQFMSASRTYIIENAALLHDVGKIGVPDSILLKPGPLTEDEWKVMRAHDHVGVGIIKSSFHCAELTAIIEAHHAWYGGNPNNPQLPTGENIPRGARILMIADAFDAMMTDRVYRQGISQEEAFAELRRCSGTQFDPELVEQFIECVLARDQSRAKTHPSVSKQTALGIGLQIESLVSALDQKDVAAIAVHAGRLGRTAAKSGVGHIAEVAAQLEQLAEAEGDPMQLAQLTNDLLELCRATQTAYLNDGRGAGGESDAETTAEHESPVGQ